MIKSFVNLQCSMNMIFFIFIYILLFQRAANMIPAHDSPLAALAFDASGTKLATASEKVRGF